MATMAHPKLILLFLWVGVTWSSAVNLHKRIYGGHDCKSSERLYHVKVSGHNNTHSNLCGGSLIHKQWVLTAAHCLNDGWDIYAVLGIHPGPGQRVEVTAGSIFADNNGGHDIMLLKLSTPSNIQPVALPNCTNPPKKGDTIQVAGLGRYRINKTGHKLPGKPPHLQCANMHVGDCEPTKNSKCYSNVPYNHRMCYNKSNVDTCGGDSGGGVIYNNMIYGVHKGSGTCACTAPAVSVKVCSYLNWINQIMTNN